MVVPPLRAFLAGVCLVAPAVAQSVDIYDDTSLRTVELTLRQANWWQLLAQTWGPKTYIKADLKFAGRVYKDVGLRFRGNSSYKAVKSQKKPFKISMDAFVPGQRLHGFRTLNLNNGYRDPTWVREVLCYWIYRKFKPASRANFVKLLINGKSWGVYINVEQINKDFLDVWFESDDGNRYRGERQPGAPGNSSALVWLGSNPNNYKKGYELKTANPTNPFVDIKQLCDVLNNTATNRLMVELPKVLDTENALWYLACNNVVPALDSYVGGGAHNYYLYNDPWHGRFAIMSWDLNASFGANGFASPASKQRWDPFNQSNNPNKPLMRRMLAQADWRARYLAHIRTLLDQVYDWKVLGPKIAQLQNVIRAEVQKDPLRLYPFALFSQNVTQDVRAWVNGNRNATLPGLKRLVDLRRAFLQNHAAVRVLGPKLADLRRTPALPTSNDTVWITVKAGGGAPTVAKVRLHWRAKGPNTAVPMFDDGKHRDGRAGDGVFGASIGKQPGGTRIEFHVSASTTQQSAVTLLPASYLVDPANYRVLHPRGQPSVRINEFVAANTRGIKDPKGGFEDWIELHNPLGRAVTVGGMFLTDDLSQPKKWMIPMGQTLQPRATLLIWADDEPTQGPFHASFKLSNAGEEIGLLAADGKTLLDWIEFGPQQADVSTGRLREGSATWVTFDAPTPGTHNAPLGVCGTRRFSALDPTRHSIALDLAGPPKVAAQVTLRVRTAPKSTTVFLMLGPDGAHITIDGRVSLLLSPPLVGPFALRTTAQGAFDLPLRIPNDKSLVGVRLAMQVYGAGPKGTQASNAVELVICR